MTSFEPSNTRNTQRRFRSSVRAAIGVGAVVAALGACSAAATDSGNIASAGAPSAGAASSAAGAASGGAPASGGSAASDAGTPAIAGSSSGLGGASSGVGGAAAGGASGGSAGALSGGSAGLSSGGTMGSGGSAAGGTGLGGTTNSFGTISGSPAIAKLIELTKNCTAANKIPADTSVFKTDAGTVVHVCSLKGGTGNLGGAVYFTADMDIDCDGLTTTHCPGTGADKDPAYDNQTSFHGPNSASNAKGPSLASENTPYVVIPEEVVFPGLDQDNGGNIVAVIYKNQIEFAVFGDQIARNPGDTNEPIGEASVRTANGLGIPPSPASGGVGSGVTYIAFAGTGSKPADMENLSQIQTLGAQLIESLLQNNQ